MERYSEYKDSGVQWLGEIPSHWTLLRNKAFMRITDEKVGKRKDVTLLSLTKQGVIVRDLSEGKGKFPKDFDAYLVVRPDNLVFCLFDIDETPRTVGLVKNVGMLTGAYTNFEINKKLVLPEYAYYYYLQVDDVKGLRPYYTGLRKVVKTNTFSQLRMPLPPLTEQQAIVSYLDIKCSKLDKLVANKEKEISLLSEMKQRIIADAVTRGLNPNVKFKATNIPWLPEIPEHWKIKPVRSLLKETTEKTETGEEELLSLSQYTGISYKKETKNQGMFEAESTIGYKKVHPGQFVMNIMLAWNGSYAVSDLEGIISPAYCVFDFITECNKMYYHYLLRLGIYSGAFKTASRGIIDSRLRLYPNRFYPFPIICPPLSEQQAIVSYITERTAKIDSLIEKLNKEIECIKEYKQRLISDVVTGQIKVS